MNKTAVKNYAVYAREKLISDIEFKAGLIGITEKGISAPLPQSNNEVQFFDIGTKDYSTIRGNEIAQRNAFVCAINAKEKELGYAAAFHHVVEQAAYTWFNRLVAVRFMEVNDYLPCRMRVLSSETTGKNEPDIVTNPFDSDMEFTDAEREYILEKKDKSENEELFRRLFIKECDALHEMLPGLFAAEGNYIELLLNISYNDENGVVYKLVHDIPEADFNVSDDGQIEIIGWLYQYYNIKEKERVFANLKKNIKIGKDDIPAATQLFTPDWIVRYMVDNSLGRLWLEGHEDSALREQMKYYLDEAEQEESVKAQLAEIRESRKDIKPEDIKFIDPCMGSGHILVYAFELLMKIYTSVGYTERDAAMSIIENNLYGLDIDPRAGQLAYFALMMKGRQYNRRVLNGEVKPNVYVTVSSAAIDDDDIGFITGANKALEKDMKSIRDDMKDADEFGSLIDVKPVDFAAIIARLEEIKQTEYTDLISITEQMKCAETVLPLVKQAQVMAQKYDVVCTNPPYMATANAVNTLADFAKKSYPNSKTDCFAMFMERCGKLSKYYYAMITQHAWMFLSSYEKLREKLIFHTTINMAHLGARAFDEIAGEVVQTTAFVKNCKYIEGFNGTYIRLVSANGETEKRNLFLTGNKKFNAKQEDFSKITGSPIAYWSSEAFIGTFDNVKLDNIANPRQGLACGDVNKYRRFWYEVRFDYINLKSDSIKAFHESLSKYAPINDGGSYRKWYGNNETVLKFSTTDYEQLLIIGNHLPSRQFYFLEGITWSAVSSAALSVRYFSNGFLFSNAGMAVFADKPTLIYLLGFLNTKLSIEYLSVFCPLMNFNAGDIKNIPIITLKQDNCVLHTIDMLVNDNISLCKDDWDSFETSWDFKKHPLI